MGTAPTQSADLGGRVGWLPKAERASPLQMRGGWGGVSRLRFPPGPHLRSSRFSRHPRLRQAPTRRFANFRNLRGLFLWGKGSRPLGRAPSPGARAPSLLETWPTGPWGLDPATLMGPGLKTLGHNPQSADLAGRWMVSEGGALQSHERRGCQHFSRWAGPQAPNNLANKPLTLHWGRLAASRIPKMPRCSSAHEKPGLLHRLISCAQSLQPSLTFLLRRNNKVQGAHS